MLKPVSKLKAAVMQEIDARGIQLVTDDDKKWWGLLRLLKADEGDDASFDPRTPFENFKWW